MKSFNQKTTIDLPNIKRRQKDTDKGTDAFDLLFENNSKPRTFEGVKQKDNLLQSYHFYWMIGLALLIAACFLVVQVVTSGPEIEKYKAITNNIEDIDTEKDIEEPTKITENDSSVPDVRFADPSVNQPQKPISVAQQSKLVVIKKVVVSKVEIAKVKPVTKSNYVASNNIKKITVSKKAYVVRTTPNPISQKQPDLKIDQTLAEIMLRPLAVIQKQSSEVGLRGLH